MYMCVCVCVYMCVCIYIYSVMVIAVRNGHCDTISNLDEADCISHSTNTLGKGTNPIILPPVMDK